MDFLKRSKTYSWIAFCAILLGDALALTARFSSSYLWYYSLVGIFAVLILLWIIGRMNGVKFGFKSVVLFNLLSNAAAPRPLSVLYLFMFVLHIGWLGNIFASSDNIVLSLIICISLIFFIILFFPSRQETKSSKATKVFVSGISQINFANRNFLPIVRMLYLTSNEERCKMIIVHSKYYDNYYAPDDPDNPNRDKPKIINAITEYLNKFYDKAYKAVDDEKTRQIYEEAKKGNNVVEILKLIIRVYAYNEFPEKKWILDPEKFTIEFTEAQDYNEFTDCFTALNKSLEGQDDTSHVLYFNLTPGTANISALMTLMAIDGDRMLYYFIPENDPKKAASLTEDEKRHRLKSVSKKEIPLDNLLSQALETLNK